MVDVTAMCAKYTGWNQKCCQCIVSKESRGNANAQNRNENGSDDVGLWQINTLNWEKCNGGKAPCDPTDNLNCAKKVYGWGGNSWKLWAKTTLAGCPGCA